METIALNLLQHTDIVTWMALVLAWIIFRYSISSARKNLIANLEKEINWMGQWIGVPYPGNVHKKDWYDPFRKVFDLTNLPALQSAIASPYSNLLNKDLQKNLVALNVGINRFNQLVQLHQDFITADPQLTSDAWYEIKRELSDENIGYDELTRVVVPMAAGEWNHERDIARFLERIENLQAAIHHCGIGTNSDHIDGFPNLHKAYIFAKSCLNEEKQLPSIKWWDVCVGFLLLLLLIPLTYCLVLCAVCLLLFVLSRQ